MRKKEAQIWQTSLLFLKTFRSLKYKGCPMSVLLLRSFQRYMLSSTRRHSFRSNRSIKARQIQKLCKPYLVSSHPDWKRQGRVLVRSHLYSITKGITNVDFLYIAHHQREYRKMLNYRGCRPLIYLPNTPCILNKKEWRIMKTNLRVILRKKSTPAQFRSIRFQTWMVNHMKKTIKDIKRCRKIFKNHAVSKVLYGSTINHQGSVISTVAQRHAVPVINIQHGILGCLGHLPLNADLNVVWGVSHKNFLLKHGANPHQINIMGPLFFRNIEKRKKLQLTVKKTKLTILVAMQPLGKYYNHRLIRTIERAIQPIKDQLQIIYKLHPDQQHHSIYNKQLRDYCSKSIMVRHGIVPLQQLIHQCDVLVTPFSTVAYEAALMKKPVLYYGKKPQIYYMRSRPHSFYSSQAFYHYCREALYPAYLRRWSKSQKLHEAPLNGQEATHQLWTLLSERSDYQIMDSQEEVFIENAGDYTGSCRLEGTPWEK